MRPIFYSDSMTDNRVINLYLFLAELNCIFTVFITTRGNKEAKP